MLGVLVALVAFSRLFLGVHTPQDVVVGAAAGLLVMALTAKLTPQIKEWIGGPAGTMISCFVQMLYITFLFPWLMNTIEKRCA